MRRSYLSAIILLLASITFARAGDWPAFRGPARSGLSDDPKLPLAWGPQKNVKWKADLPRPGNSSPIVLGGRVFVTCAEDPKGTRRSLYCFNREDGRRMWVQTVDYPHVDPTHGTNPYCASSPAADGAQVVVWHGSAGLFCYDLDGKLLWSRDLGTFRQVWGYASSPVFHGDRILLNCGPGARSFVVAVDRGSGEVLWQTDQPGGADDKSPETHNWIGSWTTPVLANIDGQDQAIIAQPGHVNAYDPKTGKILWTCNGTGDLAYADPMLSGGGQGGERVCVAVGGYGGAAIGFRLGGTGDVTAANRLWRVTEKNPQRIGTGVVIGKYVYLANEPGVIYCIELLTGKVAWQQRFPDEHFWASTVGTKDRLYATSQHGTTYVFAPDPAEFKLLQTNETGESTNSTPALSDGQIFLRTAGHLWCVEER